MMGASAGAVLAAGVSVAGPASAEAEGTDVPVVSYGHMCLDDQGASTEDFNPVQVYSCNDTVAQLWTKVTADHTIHALGKCLDVQYGGTANGTTVDLYDCNGTGAQVWVPQKTGTGIAFYNPQSDKCLDDTDWSTTPGTQAQIWACTGNANQSWDAAWQFSEFPQDPRVSDA